jgi:hypothetical protein
MGPGSGASAAPPPQQECETHRPGQLSLAMPDSLQVQWLKQYRQARYMEHLALEELQHRAGDLMKNVVELTPEGKIGAVPVDGEGADLWRKWTHVCDEFQLRFGPFPAGFTSGWVKNIKGLKVNRTAVPPEYLALASRRDILLKLGKRAHMEAMFEAGQLRIAPASGYRDPSLNDAVRDDELSFESIAPPGTKVIVSETRDGPFVPVGGVQILRMKSTLPTDYFVYCMAHSARPRLFGDFEADACVVITNPKEFIDRVVAAVELKLPGYAHSRAKVRYADPHFDHGRLPIALTKHFRFAYQREFRMIWVPPTPQKDLKPFLITVGTLKDIAALITLPDQGAQASVA